jgi:hypothetical protein
MPDALAHVICGDQCLGPVYQWKDDAIKTT